MHQFKLVRARVTSYVKMVRAYVVFSWHSDLSLRSFCTIKTECFYLMVHGTFSLYGFSVIQFINNAPCISARMCEVYSIQRFMPFTNAIVVQRSQQLISYMFPPWNKLCPLPSGNVLLGNCDNQTNEPIKNFRWDKSNAAV